MNQDQPNQINSESDLLAMRTALSEVAAIFKHSLTTFEAQAWAKIMETTPRVKFQNFLSNYLLSPEAQYGSPKLHHAAKVLGLAVDAESAYAMVEAAVKKFGPYQKPDIKDPVVVATIQVLGGWAAVNEQFPQASGSFEAKAFKDRFEAAMNTAINQVRIEGQMPSSLEAIGNARPPVLELGAPSARLISAPKG